jgi:nucleotidyltransferase/DNA polymerase involved in DNA repair
VIPSQAPDRPREVLPGIPPPPAPPRRWVLYVDLDAYYVSCELRERPELAGKPVIVGPPPSEGPTRGVVLSASYEARKFGVRSALPAGAAARMCPDAVWIRPDFPKYERIAGEVRGVLRRFSSTVIPYSIDEAAVVIDVETPESARTLAAAIQEALRAELGLPCSIGVARARILAKIATDRAKPAGIVVVPPEHAAEFLAPLPVRAIPGVGPKTGELLLGIGVATIGELASASLENLERAIGSYGRELRALARGTPHESVEVDSGPRSRSTDHTFANDVSAWEPLAATVRTLAGELAVSVLNEGFRYGTVGVAFRWGDFDRSQRSRALHAAHEGSATLEDRAVRLARELWDSERLGRGRSVRTVSVRVERLTERTQRQSSLDTFDSPPVRGGEDSR